MSSLKSRWNMYILTTGTSCYSYGCVGRKFTKIQRFTCLYLYCDPKVKHHAKYMYIKQRNKSCTIVIKISQRVQYGLEKNYLFIFDKLHKISFIGLLLNLQKCIRFCGRQSAALIHHYSTIIYFMNICKNI